MELEDARKLDPKTQAALRRRAIKQVEAGGRHAEVARTMGVARCTVTRWVGGYRKLGEAFLRPGRRGRRAGEPRALSRQESLQVQGWIRDKCPDQLKLPFALWTARSVRDLISRQFRKTLSIRTVQLYLKRWGMSPQKPVFRAKQRSNPAIQRWLEDEYPALKERAKREGASIQWSDETGVNNQDHVGRSYAPIGQKPVIRRTAKRFTTSMISSITNKGEMRFMLYEGALNVALFMKFLKRLIADSNQKIFLIVDNLKVHKANKLKAWLQIPDIKQQLEVFYLPAYAPELNPDELLNNDLKQQLNNKPRPNDNVQFLRSIRAVLRTIQAQPQRLCSYFNHPDVSYAAS